MGVRMTACLMVIIGCSGIGFFQARETEKRMLQLKELNALFLLMRSEIRFQHAALEEALDMLARKSRYFKAFFEEIVQRIHKLEGKGFYDIWIKALEKHRRASSLKQEDIEMLDQFGKMFGRLDTEMQISALDWYLTQEKEKENELRALIPKRIVLYRGLGIMAGVFLVVLLEG